MKKLPRPYWPSVSAKLPLISGIFGALFALSCAHTAPPAEKMPLLIKSQQQVGVSQSTSLEELTDSIARSLLNSGTTPGMTVAVAKNGQVLMQKAYGRSNLASGQVASPKTIYKIGSVTKQFTAACIMRLAEQGKISLDDPITKFLPDYPVQGHHVTVHHLLNHTSGIKSFTMQEDKGQLFMRELSYADMVNRFGKQRFDFQPGQKYAYNNTAYYLLGEIITQVSGMPYQDYLERELLQPLGLENTSYCQENDDYPTMAKGYRQEEGKYVSSRYVNMRNLGGAGALCSTAGDLIRWTRLLHSGKVISQESLQLMTTPTLLANGDTVGYGYGLFTGALSGHPKIYHGGRGAGFLALVSHYPEDELTVVVLMNSETNRQQRDQVEKVLAQAVLNIKKTEVALPTPDTALYTGTYSLRAGSRTANMRIFGADGKLLAQIADGKAETLHYMGNHRFGLGEDDAVELTFTVTDGRADSVRVSKGGQVLLGKRTL